jgi:hypothetical protein
MKQSGNNGCRIQAEVGKDFGNGNWVSYVRFAGFTQLTSMCISSDFKGPSYLSIIY